MPQIHIQFRFLGVGIIRVSYSRPTIGSRLCSQRLTAGLGFVMVVRNSGHDV